MFTYIVRRLLLMIPTLFGITALVFFVMGLSPGGIGGPTLDKFGNLKGEQAAFIREYYNKRYGLDKPLVVQYVRWLNHISPIGYEEEIDTSGGQIRTMRRFKWLKWPDLGESLNRHRPVTQLIGEALPVTLALNLISLPIVYIVGILTGIKAAKSRGKLFDTVSSTMQLSAWSVPTIWAGVLLIGFFANREYFKWFPVAGLHEMEAQRMAFLPHFTSDGWQRGYLLDNLWHLILPVICLSYGTSAFLTKLTRGSVLENLNADYARTARAKGLPEKVVLYRHVFRNSLLALTTYSAAVLPALISGSVIVESIFSIPGMGRLGVEGVAFRDRELVLAVTLIGGIIGLLSQLLRDILYALEDPRVSYD
jgi:ABC-type dipeptide/oligopeptide/nickel transport system permease component